MNERENYLAVMNGKQPEWVPNFHDAVDLIPPFIVNPHFFTEEQIDCCGVHWVVNDAGAMPDTTVPPIMSDASQWRKYVRLPDIESFDWENVSARELEHHSPDKGLVLIVGLGGGSFFIPLMNMMGFQEGLCALLEDEDSVREMFETFFQFYVKLLPCLVKYYNPDTIIMGDDICTQNGAFISYELYEDLLKPYYQRLIEIVHGLGVKFELHMCGRCERFIDDFVDMGIDSWQPAQGINDLKNMKAKYNGKLVMVGTWSTSGPAGEPGASEEIVRKEVRDCMDSLAPGGGMIFWNGDPVGSSEDQLQKMAWMDDEARKYGKAFYKK